MIKTRVVHVNKEPYDVYIGRANSYKRLKKSKWANPFRIDQIHNSRDDIIASYRTYLEGSPELLADLPELRGQVLGCWCAPEACHGDVLAEFVERYTRGNSAPPKVVDPQGTA